MIKNENKKIALIQIVILVLGIIAISWMVGRSVEIVSASGTCTTAEECSPLGSAGWECVSGQCVTKCNVAGGQCADINGNDCSSGFENNWCPTNGANIKCCTGTVTGKAEAENSADNSLLTTATEVAGGIALTQGTIKGVEKTLDKIKGTLSVPTEKLPDATAEVLKTTSTSTGSVETASKFSKMTAFITSQELTVGNVIANAGVAVAIGYLSYYIGRGLGLTEDQASGLGMWAAGGYGIGYVGAGIANLLGASLSLGVVGLIGAGVAILGYLTFKKRQGVSSIIFSCYSWSPVTGGQRCEECNDLDVPCNEYQCQSLGQGCELVKDPTSEDYGVCVWKNPNDFAWPVLTAWDEALLNDFVYTPDNQVSPPDQGVFINYIGDEIVEQGKQNTRCIPPFTVLRFGIESNEPAQCKISLDEGQSFEDMSDIFLSNGRTLYNHTVLIKHKSKELEEAEIQQLLKDLEEEGENVNIDDFELENDKEYSYYVKCADANGNSNPDEFIFEFCVSDFDATPPVIEWVNPLNGNPIAHGDTEEKVTISINEPSECRWSHTDKSFDNMEYSFDCNNENYIIENANLVYTCDTILTGLKDNQDNNFYFRCKDKPNEIYGILYEDGIVPESERNVMEESYEYTLVGTQGLVIDWVTPNNTKIKDSTEEIKVEIEAHTSIGYNEGESRCLFSETGKEGTYIQFANTNSYLHSQELYFEEGSYEFFIRCIDLGGNTDETKINFSVETDVTAPIVVRAFKDGNDLTIVTDEEADCVYSNFGCTYIFTDGTPMTTLDGISHFTDWNIENDYYIKCMDQYGKLPSSNQCSLIARPFEIFQPEE